ncbi:hypothetical protein [Paenarthrobacter nicotinovorans]|uniref:hypothetical protein n=1 Tax=Paenarthrobacter nicotinovorans TaxID=29320 RepID=UPI0021B2CEDB|nr:hypothetical protein [Paenarthrobacter nicotinovorans]
MGILVITGARPPVIGGSWKSGMNVRRIRLVAVGVGDGVGVAEGEAVDAAASLGAGSAVELSAPAAGVQAVRPATTEAAKIPKAALLLGTEKGTAEWSPHTAFPRG